MSQYCILSKVCIKKSFKAIFIAQSKTNHLFGGIFVFSGRHGGIFLTPGDEYEPILYSSKNISELNLVKGLYKKIFLKRFLLLKGIV
jgi:hypothetical protein